MCHFLRKTLVFIGISRQIKDLPAVDTKYDQVYSDFNTVLSHKNVKHM